MRKITTIIFIIFMSVIIIPSVFALGFATDSSTQSGILKENDIGFSRITPDSPIYFLKAVREAFELKLAITSRVRFLRDLEFATRRLREARTLIYQKHEDLVMPTLERYMADIQELPKEHAPNEEVGVKIVQNLPIHLQVLETMYDETSNLRSRMAIRSVMNRLIQRPDLISNAKVPVCELFEKEASASALNQTEKVVLSNRAQKCFKSLVSNSQI